MHTEYINLAESSLLDRATFFIRRTQFYKERVENGMVNRFEKLREVLKDTPQKDDNGNSVYLITGGWAVDILTGIVRDHRDVDSTILVPYEQLPFLPGTDSNRAPFLDKGINLSPDFLQSSSITRSLPFAEIITINPAIILTEKIADTFLYDTDIFAIPINVAPRMVDIYDALAILLSNSSLQLQDSSVLSATIASLEEEVQHKVINNLQLLRNLVRGKTEDCIEPVFLEVIKQWVDYIDPYYECSTLR